MEKLELNHKKLDTWKLSRKFVKDIYKATNDFPKAEMYGIVSQIRRASVSIVCNIAEGSARRSPLERKRFYEISRSSMVEVDTLLELSLDLSFIEKDKYEELCNQVTQIFKMISKLIEKTN
ncbi:MAG: four helix bundle protein [Ignavibacteria bacterium]